MNKKILYIINEGYFFLSHKKDLAAYMQNLGHEVHIAIPKDHVWAPKDFSNDILKEMGLICHEYDLSRRGQNIFFELRSFLQILKIIIIVKPSILHLMTIKPIIYGGIISLFLNKTLKVFSITGLGQVFTEKSIFAKLRRVIVIIFLKRIFLSINSHLIVQNNYDYKTIILRNPYNNYRFLL